MDLVARLVALLLRLLLLLILLLLPIQRHRQQAQPVCSEGPSFQH